MINIACADHYRSNFLHENSIRYEKFAGIAAAVAADYIAVVVAADCIVVDTAAVVGGTVAAGTAVAADNV